MSQRSEFTRVCSLETLGSVAEEWHFVDARLEAPQDASTGR